MQSRVDDPPSSVVERTAGAGSREHPSMTTRMGVRADRSGLVGRRIAGICHPARAGVMRAGPGQYLAAVGRRAIAMGSENGRLELWSCPIK